MAEKSISEKAGEAVGYGIAMAEDLAGGVKNAVGAAVTTVTEVLRPSPTKKAVTKRATTKVSAKKAVKKVPAKKATPLKAAKRVPAKKAVTKKATKKTTAKKAAKKVVAKKTAAKKAAEEAPKGGA